MAARKTHKNGFFFGKKKTLLEKNILIYTFKQKFVIQ